MAYRRVAEYAERNSNEVIVLHKPSANSVLLLKGCAACADFLAACGEAGRPAGRPYIFLAPFASLREIIRFGCGLAALGLCGDYVFTGDPGAP